MNITLTEEEWYRLLNCAALAPYAQVQPLIAKISDQLLKQRNEAQPGTGSETQAS